MNTITEVDQLALRVVRRLLISLGGRDIPPDDAEDLLKLGVVGWVGVFALASISAQTLLHILDPRISPLLVDSSSWRHSLWSWWWDTPVLVFAIATSLLALLIVFGRARSSVVRSVGMGVVSGIGLMGGIPNLIPMGLMAAAVVGVLAIRRAIVDVAGGGADREEANS